MKAQPHRRFTGQHGGLNGKTVNSFCCFITDHRKRSRHWWQHFTHRCFCTNSAHANSSKKASDTSFGLVDIPNKGVS